MIRLCAVLAALALAWGCGGDSPAAPPPTELPRPTTVTVTPAAAELRALGATVQLTAEVRDQSARVMAGAAVRWRSGDASVATVGASGLVTAAGEGRATITASAGSGEGSAEITVVELERPALVALYEATDGPNWIDSENWLTDAPLGSWYGVETDGSGRVVGLDLGGVWDSEAGQPTIHGLSGVIPPELGDLTSLANLDLGYNLLSGPIPPELENLVSLRRLVLRRNLLTGAIPPELGDLPRLETLDLFSNDLSGPIPPEIGSLTRLRWLVLSSNGLSGPVPPELGDLQGLTRLYLRRNALSGPIPESFLQLDAMERFRFEANTDLCTAGTTDFVAWLERIEAVSGPYCNESDMKVLDRLYRTSGGASWTNSTGWLETPALDRWHGVTADAVGRVARLDLAGNGLEGRLPAALGSLEEMSVLRVGDNAISGRLPLSLARPPLLELRYAGTELCVPAEPSFRAWLDGLLSHEGTGVECGLLTDREALVALYETMGGPNWVDAENWLTDAPIGDWHGVESDASGRVVRLVLFRNNLTGPIPPEIGSLARLERLGLARNGLTGRIPPEIGNLTSLESLNLYENALSGPLPAEIGSLTGLRWLYLSDNGLSGPIPAEIGNLARLESLSLSENELTGPIPAEIAGLSRVTALRLDANDLTGPIPPEIGSLTRLRGLLLADNNLTGPIPSGLGDLSGLAALALDNNNLTGTLPLGLAGVSALRQLSLGNNAGLSGPLPAALTDLRLEVLLAGGTDLCAPPDAHFQTWLRTVQKQRVTPCGRVAASMAYLTQAVQSREYPVPLVAGERALLRVFVTAAEPTTANIPPVRARFYLNGIERHMADIPSRTTAIPTEVAQNNLSASANAEVPADVIQPGLEMVVEIDPEGTLDPGLGAAKRIPETGRMPVEVREMPVFELTVIPFLWQTDPDSAVVEAAEAMEADPEGHELLWDTRTLLPIADLEVRAHTPVLSSSNSKFVLLTETRAIRAMEGGTGHFLGMMSGTVSPGGGVALRPGRESFSEPYASTIAHELGHNLSLRHAPCGGAGGPDPSFPYRNGSVGVWGYDFRDGGRLVQPGTPDLMSYCRPRRISDYHFTNSLRFRLFDEQPELLASAAPPQEGASLLLWGGADPDGQPFLNPAFVIDAPPALPNAGGEHRITGWTTDGNELFVLDFAMPELADGDGSSSFTFVLPVEPAWADALAGITLSGPGGSTTLDGDTDIPMTILLDPGTGEVRGILRDVPQADAAAALAPQAGPDTLDVLFSRGIPDAAAWGR